jgi:hypothetical protein
MERIKRMSAVIRLLSQIAFWGTLGFTSLLILFLILPGNLFRFLGQNAPTLEILNHKIMVTELDAFARLVTFLMIILALTPLLFGLRQFYRLFLNYERGQVFTPDSIFRIRMLGWILVASFPLSVAARLLKHLLALYLKISSTLLLNLFLTNFGFLIVGIAVVLISWVMNEAKKLQDEQDLMV